MSIADLVGVLLGIILLVVATSYGLAQGGRRAGLVMFLAVGSHLALAFLAAANVVLGPTVGDTGRFHDMAVDMALGVRPVEFTVPSSSVWAWLISMVYQPLGPSLLLGFAVNAWIFFLAVVQLLKFSDEIGANKYRWHVALVFGLAPASILFLNLLFRESVQALLLIFAIRQLEQYRRAGSIRPLALGALAFVPFGAIHDGFYIFGPIAIAVAVAARLWLPPLTAKINPSVKAVTALVGAVGLVALVVLVVGLKGSVGALLSGNLDVAALITDAADRGARTAFPWAVGTGLAGTVLSMPILMTQFLFAPIVPSMVTAPEDLVAVAEVLLRTSVFFLCVIAYRRGDSDTKRSIVFLTALYVIFDMMAAVGTTTVGTAMRHDVKVLWIPIATAALAWLPARVASSREQITVPGPRLLAERRPPQPIS